LSVCVTDRAMSYTRSYSNPEDQLEFLLIREVSLTRKIAMLEGVLTRYYQQALKTTLSEVEQRCMSNDVSELSTARIRLPQVPTRY